MNEAALGELAGWVTQAGLIGRSESEMMAGFCQRVNDAGVPLARAIVILDTLHPIYEGRAFRWRSDMPEAAEAVDYGRTNEGEAAENWRNSPFFHLLQSGETAMRAVWLPAIRRIFTADFLAEQAPVTVPTHGGKHGHPVCIARPVMDELLMLPPEAQASDVIHRYVSRTSYIEVPDSAILTDVDDRAAYAELMSREAPR